MTQGVSAVAHTGTTLEIRPLKPNIGAQVCGVDLREPLDAAAMTMLHRALAEHGVLVFHDQELTVEEQMAFGRCFGDLSVHPFSAHLAEHTEVIVLDYTEENPPSLTDIWHSDETFRAEPPMATMLYAKIIPALGGDTMFANMAAAYEGLSAPMKTMIDGLETVHDFKPFRTLFTHSEAHRKRLYELEEQYPLVTHPVVRIPGWRCRQTSTPSRLQVRCQSDSQRWASTCRWRSLQAQIRDRRVVRPPNSPRASWRVATCPARKRRAPGVLAGLCFARWRG
ncbi:hypothetical protein C2W62_13315 [Candidatus Entotheonella serta]|nr:hypothetical protein C2W62_13315 [Candidatus Entotheonella serta]